MSASLDDLFDQPRGSRLRDLIKFAQENKLEVGSTTGGRHNRGSKHPSGNAIDIRNSGNFSDEQVQQLSHAAADAGFKLRDERRRPPRQAVWGGPHLHVETDPQNLNDLFDSSSGQTPPVSQQRQPANPPSVPATKSKQSSVPKVLQNTNLLRQFAQQRAVQESLRQRAETTRAEVEKEYRGRRGMYGSPTPSGMLHLFANPIDSFTGLFRSDEENINRETQERLRQQRVAAEPEVQEIRREYGRMSAPTRTVVAPLARGGAGLLKTAGGIASAFGIAPNRLSEWANKRGEIIETGASMAPLAEERGLSSLITGQANLKEIERGVPEKIATGIADLGVGLGQIILLKRATGLRFNQVLALEAAAKNSDKSADTQLSRAAEAYTLGTALDRHLSRSASATIAGVPTAAQTGYEVSQDRMSPLDAAIQTGIQAGSGAILTTPKPRQQARPVPETFTQQRQARTEAQGREMPQRLKDIRRRVSEPLEDLFDEPQSKVQPSVEAQRAEVEPVVESSAPQASRLDEAISSRTARQDHLAQLKSELSQWRQAGGKGRLGAARIKQLQREINDTQRSLDAEDQAAATQLAQERAAAVEATRYSPTPRFDEWVENQTGQRMGQVPETELARLRERYRREFVDAPMPPLERELPPLKAPLQRFFHRDFGEVVEAPNQRKVGKNRVRVVGEDGKEHIIKRSAMTGAGNQRAVPIRQDVGEVDDAPPSPAFPAIPERPETIETQMQALANGTRDAVLVPRGEPKPKTPRGIVEVATEQGSFYVNPRKVSSRQVIQKVKDGTAHELLGIVEPKSEKTTATVAARTPEGVEAQAVAVSPERAPEQAAKLKQQYPEAKIETGGPELAEQILTERTAGQRERGFARSTERAGLPVGESRYYDPITHKQSLLNAEQRISELGVEGAARELTRKKEIDADDVATGIRLMQKLNASGETQRSAEIADHLQKQLTKTGQASSAASIISRLSPEGILMVTQRNLPKGEKLTREQSASLVSMAQRVQQAEARVVNLQERVSQLEQQPRSQSRPRIAERIGTVEARLKEMETAARARLDARKQQATALGPQSGASTIPLDIADYAIIGASKVAQKGMSSARWTAEMISEFGEDIRPHLKSIYRESYKLYNEQKQELARQREERAAIKAAGGPVSGDELNQLIAQRAQARSDARKARAEMGRLYQQLTRTRGEKIKGEVVDVLGLPRSFKSSMDLSAPRQGAMWVINHPIQGTRLFFGKQLQAMKETNYDRFVDQLESDPDFPLMIKSRLALTTPETQAHNLTAREEAFASRLAGRIPGVKHSERAYITFLDTARASWFKQLKGLAEQKAKSEGRTLEQSDYDAIANFVNISTGRGNLGQGKFNNVSPVLNALFFAPKFAVSKVQAFDPRVYARLPAGARKQALREAATFYGGMASVALLLKFGLGLSVGLDPEDSEFMKLKVGNTRYDLSNGTGQYIRLAAQLLRNAENKRTGKKDAFGHSFMENMDRFLRYKYSPPAGFVRNVWEGKNPIGEKTSAGKEAIELVTPLFLDDMYEAFQKEGLSGAAKTTPGFVGVGVQTYERKKKSKLIGGYK